MPAVRHPPDSRFGAVAFVHRFGSYLNSDVHIHVLVTEGVFSAGDGGEAVFHPALDLEPGDFEALQAKMRHRGRRWLHRHGHLDDGTLHVLDSLEHAGGWSVDASVAIPGWDRQGLERLVRICECLPLRCQKCGEPMRIIAFGLDRPVIERIPEHIGIIGGRAWLPAVRERLPPVGRRPTADAAAYGLRPWRGSGRVD